MKNHTPPPCCSTAKALKNKRVPAKLRLVGCITFIISMAIPLISAAQCTTNVNISSSSNSDTVCAGSSVTLTASGVALASPRIR